VLASETVAGNVRHLGSLTGPPREQELRPGDVLEGRYTLLSPLGEGGMGDVWLALNAMLDIKVALKVLRVDDKHPERRAKMTQRLLQEARAAAQLGHPAIVRITDFGETPSGNGFFVMELLEGEDLHKLLERHGRLSAVKAVRTLLPIAHALVAAHSKNIVHRDLKPENIFLVRDEHEGTVQPKLIDFGVAKLQKVANERITMAGAVLGSPGYMAPEQARGEDVDERADVWGLTVVIYETVTGRLPFEGKNYNALIRSIIEDKPSPITSFGVGDDALSEILLRGLAKDPDKRWQSMRELGTALARWLVGRKITEDICGAQLAAIWLRDRREAALASSSPPDPFDTGSVAAPELLEALRVRAELTTQPPSPIEQAPAISEPAARPVSIVRARPITVAALLLGTIGGIALGGWALRRGADVPAAAPFVAVTASQRAPSASVVAIPTVSITEVAATPALPETSARASQSTPAPRPSFPKIKQSTATATAAPPAATNSQLKNPF